MTESTLELSRVGRRFGEAIAVDDVSLEVRRGETVALLGPNGAGKTTLLEMVLGLRRPDRGTIRVLGTAAEKATAAGHVGAMLQEGGLPPGARVAELVDLIRRRYPRPPALEDVLRLAGLEPLAGRRVERLSGGEQQRARLALALAGGNELLVLHEPTAAMDVAARRSFWAAARRSAAGGRSLVFATHRLDEADEVADRVIVMAAGRVVADGDPADLKSHAGGSSTVSFAADGVALEVLERLPAVEAVDTAGGRVSLRTHDPDRTVRALMDAVPILPGLEVTGSELEEVFAALTSEGSAMISATVGYVRFEVARQFRNRDALLFRLDLPAGLYVVFRAVISPGAGGTSEGLPSDLAAMVVFAVFGALYSTVFASGPPLAKERAIGWLRQLRVTPLPAGVAVAGKVAAAMAFALPSIVLVTLAAPLTQDVRLVFDRWLELTFVIWLAATAFTALGVLIGLAIGDPEAAQSTTSGALIVMWLFGGLVTAPSNLPGRWRRWPTACRRPRRPSSVGRSPAATPCRCGRSLFSRSGPRC